MAISQKAAISFALVYIPVNLYTATQDNDIRFNQLAKETKGRVRYKKVDESTGKELSNEDIVKGFEYDKGKYVVVTDEDFEKIKTEKDRNIKIAQFSEMREICPIYYEKAYYVTPQKGGEKAFELLRQAMLARNKIAVGMSVLGTKEVIVSLIPADDGILLQTLYYENEVKEVPREVHDVKLDKSEMTMADKIIETMEKPFKPEEFQNDYQDRLRALIEDKIEGKEISIPKSEGGAKVINLMDALKASMDELSVDDKKPVKARKTPPKPRRKTG
jgi:Ku protein, prokaryotic